MDAPRQMYGLPRIVKHVRSWRLVAVLLLGAPALAQPALVLYPVVREPYDRIYRDTIEGITQTYAPAPRVVPVVSDRALSPDVLGGGEVRVAVALGNQAAMKLHQLDSTIPIITTATGDLPFQHSHQLAYFPAPEVLLEQVRRFDARIRRVKLVSTTQTAEYQTRVQRALAQAGIELEACSADSLKQAADCYRALLAEVKAGDALWLLHGGKLLEPSLLSFILDIAWRNHLTVFSSNPTHVRRGALFAIYPDNQAAGRQLGQLLHACLESCDRVPRINYLREMKVVLNQRTSSHLGLDVAPEARQGVDLL